MKFMQNPIIQKIVFILAVLFIVDMVYTFGLHGRYSYIKITSKYPCLYQIDKWTGNAWWIVRAEGKKVKWKK